VEDYELTQAAQDDVEDIIETIAADDLNTARKFEEEVYRAFQRLAENPHAGHARTDLTDRPVFFLTVMRSFTVIYRKSTPVLIVRVVRWKRVTQSFLFQEA
jgi:plasmid stabilization system protein ParE